MCVSLGYFLGPAPGAAAAFLSALPALECPLKMRVSANSPSLWPTMFSVTYTGMCCLPLCTASVRPTKSGITVERRDQVLIGRLSLVLRALSTFCIRWWSTKGPFLIERDMAWLPYFVRRSRPSTACVGLLRRVLKPLVCRRRGETGGCPAEVRPAPPPCGWSIGFIA